MRNKIKGLVKNVALIALGIGIGVIATESTKQETPPTKIYSPVKQYTPPREPYTPSEFSQNGPGWIGDL